jgi:hypothetical protein
VLDAEQARLLLDSIDTSTVVGLRDRALISVMTFAFARVGARAALLLACRTAAAEDYAAKPQECAGQMVKCFGVGGLVNLMPRNAIAVVSMVIFCLYAGGGVSYSEAAVDKAEYELQERCGRRAAEMFEKQYGTGFVVTDIGGYRRTTYSSNYNATFNKCYMSLHTDNAWQRETRLYATDVRYHNS